mmetsp:Transcript_26236/g.33917  ORF Transcript_26236/g.33917 Transcript_26236/m.33917 type:complete len:246 (+) Transcript_26236:125-862(+)
MADLALNQAALNENIDQVRAQLARGGNPNWRNTAKNQYMNTALHHVAFKGNNDIATLLITHGADCEIENLYGNKPLMFAAYYGKVSTLKTLINLGADVSAFSSKTGLTALHKACMQGHVKVAKILLDSGAFPNALDNKGRKPENVIGIEGERNVSDEERSQIAYFCQTGGQRLHTGLHQHELAFSVVFAPEGRKCNQCEEFLPQGTVQFVCPDDGFRICQTCLDVSRSGGQDTLMAFFGKCQQCC